MDKICDHTSVGILVWKEDKLLFIERKKFPFGFAVPAGHVDDDKSYEEAARRELKEEVGLDSERLELLIEGRKENHCRRAGGDWHYWKIYQAKTEGIVKRSLDETKRADWLSKDEIRTLAQKTERYLAGEVSEGEWEKNPGIEIVWFEWFKELNLI